MMMTFENSLSKLGIHTDGVGTTDIAGFGPTQPLTDGMAQIFQLSINKGYQNFITLVAENRNMTLAKVNEVAQGRVWSGKKAQELGLVDELGNLTDAVVAAAKLANLTKYDTLLVEKEVSERNKVLQKLMGGAQSLGIFDSGFITNSELTSSVSTSTKPMTQFISQLQTEVTKMNQFNDPQGIYTLCLACGAP
jgi:protease-4